MFYELSERIFGLEKNGKRIISLNIGDTNLPTPECAVDAAVKSIKTKKSGYGPAAGLAELRERIAEREGCGMDEVVVGPGSKHLIYALMCIIGKGGSLVFPSPHWPAYGLAARQLGIRTNVVRTKMENKWQFAELPLSNAKMAIICNPLNPTSTVYPEKDVRDAINDADRKNVPVILDEAYKGLSFRKIPNYDAIRVRSFSKEFNMEGWRLGYAIVPKKIAKKLIAYNQITATCVPEFVQRAGMACLENEKTILSKNRRIWKNRLETAARALTKAGFRFVKPESGIYVFATHDSISDCGRYASRLLGRRGVAVAPGSDFGDYKKFVRICPSQPEKVLEYAIGKMGGL